MRVVILGAGLAGLTTAYLLKDHPIDVTILESRNRLGGRIWTQKIQGGARVEAGATWFGLKHEYLVRLLDQLQIGYYPQATAGISLYDATPPDPPQYFRAPEDEPESYRIHGGSYALIEALAHQLPPSKIHLGDPVETIHFADTSISIYTRLGRHYHADFIVSTLPPQLFEHSITTSPKLDATWTHIANQTHTWMSTRSNFLWRIRQSFGQNNRFRVWHLAQPALSLKCMTIRAPTHLPMP